MTNLETEIKTLTKKAAQYDKTQNEGGEGYNPYRDQIEAIQDKIINAKDITWTKDRTIARRAEWKQWVLKTASENNGKIPAKKMCKQVSEQGWDIDCLKRAVKKYNL